MNKSTCLVMEATPNTIVQQKWVKEQQWPETPLHTQQLTHCTERRYDYWTIVNNMTLVFFLQTTFLQFNCTPHMYSICVANVPHRILTVCWILLLILHHRDTVHYFLHHTTVDALFCSESTEIVVVLITLCSLMSCSEAFGCQHGGQWFEH